MTAPITDITVLIGKDAQTPPNYTRIPYDLNRGARGNFLWLCYRRTLNARKEDCITGLEVLVGNKVNPGPGFTKIPVDLNRDTRVHKTSLWLAYKKGGNDLPIKDIIVHSQQYPPDGYEPLKEDLNRGARGDTIHLAYLRGEEDKISPWGERGIDFELFKKVLDGSPGDYEQEIARWQSDLDKQIIWKQKLMKIGPWTVPPYQEMVYTSEIYSGTTKEEVNQWEVHAGVHLESSATIGASAKGVEAEVSRKASADFDYGYLHRTAFAKEEYTKITDQTKTNARDYGYSVAVVQFVNTFELKQLPYDANITAIDARSKMTYTGTTGKDGTWAKPGTLQEVMPPVALKKIA